MTEAEIAAANSAYFLDNQRIDALQNWVRAHYRDDLTADSFADPSFALEIRNAHLALTKLIQDFH